MNEKITKETVEKYFLDYVEGKLTESDRAIIDTLLKEDTELQQSLSGYQQVIAMEEELARQEHKLHENFVVKVMERLDESAPGFSWRKIMKHLTITQKTLAGLATCAVLVLCIQIGADLGDKTGPDASIKEKIELAEKEKKGATLTTPPPAPQEMKQDVRE
ncbi:MAG: hypothetical protein KDD55_07745, partial [Bdellovibrionales bacterium]|nr:hypothetical protein [Bdellovibrionales bacterium]